MCQPSRCFPKGVDTRRCASKDAGPLREWIWGRSHIDWRKERVPTRTLGLKGEVDCDVPHWLGGKQTTVLKP